MKEEGLQIKLGTLSLDTWGTDRTVETTGSRRCQREMRSPFSLWLLPEPSCQQVHRRKWGWLWVSRFFEGAKAEGQNLGLGCQAPTEQPYGQVHRAGPLPQGQGGWERGGLMSSSIGDPTPYWFLLFLVTIVAIVGTKR